MSRLCGVVTVVCLAPALACASGFGAPVRIFQDSDPTYQTSSVAVDGNGGTALALLSTVQNGGGVNTSSISTASRAARSKWGPLGAVYGYHGHDATSTPVTLSSAGGLATTVWEDSAPSAYTSTIYAADRPLGGAWTTQKVFSFPSPSFFVAYTFLMNDAGDAAILFVGPQSSSTVINAIRRPAGSTVWGPLETVAAVGAGDGVGLSAGAIDAHGNVSVAWQGYVLVCPHRCHAEDVMLHVSTAAPGSTAWQDSGALPGIPKSGGISEATLTTDGKGRTALAIQTPAGIAIAHQRGAGLAWSRPVNVAAPSSSGFLTILGFVTADNGASDLLYTDFLPTDDSIAVDRVNGSIATNLWSSATALVPAVADQSYGPQFLLGASQSGRGLLGWVLEDGTVQAITTASPQRGWGSPATIVKGSGSTSQCLANTCTVLEGVSIASTGRAAITYKTASPTKPNTVVYAVTN